MLVEGVQVHLKGAREECRILCDDSNLFAKLMNIDFINVLPVDLDFAVADLNNTRHGQRNS